MNADDFDRGHLQVGAGEQLLLPVVEHQHTQALHALNEAGTHLFSPVHCHLLDVAFHARAHHPELIPVRLQVHHVCYLLLVLRRLSQIYFDWSHVLQIDWLLVFIELLDFLFVFLLL